MLLRISDSHRETVILPRDTLVQLVANGSGKQAYYRTALGLQATSQFMVVLLYDCIVHALIQLRNTTQL